MLLFIFTSCGPLISFTQTYFKEIYVIPFYIYIYDQERNAFPSTVMLVNDSIISVRIVLAIDVNKYDRHVAV